MHRRRSEIGFAVSVVKLLSRQGDRNVPHPIDLLVCHQLDAAMVEGAKCGAVADGNNGHAFETILQQAVQNRLSGLVERSRGFVEEKVVGRVQQHAGNSEPLLLAQ